MQREQEDKFLESGVERCFFKMGIKKEPFTGNRTY